MVEQSPQVAGVSGEAGQFCDDEGVRGTEVAVAGIPFGTLGSTLARA